MTNNRSSLKRITARILLRLGCVPLLGFALGAEATVYVDGQLTATKPCAAVTAIKRGDNPGQVHLESGHTYPVLGKNKEDATHLLVRIQGAKPDSRWIELSCGTLNADKGNAGKKDAGNGNASKGNAGKTPANAARTPPASGQFMLAASWLPAFCETQRRRPECRDQSPRSPDAGRFSLHGLWPQPASRSYCGVSTRDRERSKGGDWSRLPALALDDATRRHLDELMPGTQSYLQRHQWTKHGTCYGTPPDAYFRDSLRLLEELNQSAVTALFARSIGRHLSATDVRKAFDSAYGAGAGQRVRLACRDGMINELRISLKGEMRDGVSLQQLMLAAPTKSPGCRGGRVDAAGIQTR